MSAAGNQHLRTKTVIASLAIAIALLTWRHETLWLPPFQDQAVGYWKEASFLADSHFDYYRLRYHENHYMDDKSGPRSYMISLIPTVVAGLMSFASDPATVIVIVRLMSFGLAGYIGWFVFRHLQEPLGRFDAALVTASLLTLPTFITQVEIMGMDVPLTVALLLSLSAMVRGKVALSLAWAAAAFAAKATGQLVSLVGITFWICQGLAQPSEPTGRSWRWHLGTVLCYLGLFVLEAGILAWGDTSVAYLAIDSWPWILKPTASLPNLTPDIGILLVVGLVATIRAFGILGMFPQDRSAWRSLFQSPRGWWARAWRIDPWLAVCWITILGLLASSALYIYTPRYVFCSLPCLFIVLGRSLLSARVSIPFARVLLVGLILFNLANADGRYLPNISPYGREVFDEIPGLTPRSNAFTERSREYLKEHRSSLAAATVLEGRFPQHPIFAPVPTLFYLDDPRLGYVHTDLDLHDASLFRFAIQAFVDLYATAPGKPSVPWPVLVEYAHSRTTLPGPEPNDEILYEDSIEPPLRVYVKSIPDAVRADRRQLEDWYLDRTWDNRWMVSRLVGRFDFLLQTGRADRLRRELTQALHRHPHHPTLTSLAQALSSR
jgi:hypothetical protein